MNVPQKYVMRPADVIVTYNSGKFATVKLELAVDELGGGDESIEIVAPEIVELFTCVGLGAPEPVAVLSIEHQIVQKLHACTDLGQGSNERAHDLVDLQLLCSDEDIDFAEMNAVGRRLFDFRKGDKWPHVVIAHARWETLYVEASQGLDVRPLVEAIEWMNSLIGQAVGSGSPLP